MSRSTDQSPAPVWAVPADLAAQETMPASPYEVGPASTPPRKSSKVKTAIVGIVAALVIGGGGFAVIRAAGDSSSATTQQAGPGGQGGPGGLGGAPQDGGPGGFGGGAADVNGALYGDFVSSDGNGGYTTERLQSGTVTAVSTTSITARSADGHSTTFVVQDGAVVADVKTGDTVTIVGTVDGDTVTATSITETGQ
ncbi:hypothetical protein ACFFX1_03965 [Dactylosporangium sucinum]|nr:hypothetical protein [Dactylosporangium sucinum]